MTQNHTPTQIAEEKTRVALTEHDLEVLTNAASNWATELTDYVIPFAEESDLADARKYEGERDAIQAVLGRYLDASENEV